MQLDFIALGKPMQPGCLERFNGKFRDEGLNQHRFTDLDDTPETIAGWREDYNTVMPHGALGNLTPLGFAARLRQRDALSA